MAIKTHIPNQVFENVSKQPDPMLRPSGKTPWQDYIDEANKVASLLGVRSVNTTQSVSSNPPAQWSIGTGTAIGKHTLNTVGSGGASATNSPNPDLYVYIVAGNFKEYTEYVDRKHNEWLKPDSSTLVSPYFYINVSHVDKLRGLNKIQGFFIGSYEQRADINLIKSVIENIKSKTV
jgi:hypothetical protein